MVASQWERREVDIGETICRRVMGESLRGTEDLQSLGIRFGDKELVVGLEVAVIIVAAVLSSLLGAVVPAILAARANPVDALRYE